MKLKPIREQVVVIAGAASGIGRATALEITRRGAKVVAGDNDLVGLQTLQDEVRQRGGTLVPVEVDVADFAQVQSLADRASQEFGRIDSWIHVAAVALYATFEQTTPEEFRRVIDVNLMGQVHGAKAALPYLAASGGGALIHISSIEAKRALPYHSAYAASKHGIDGFLEALRLELRHQGLPISVTEIMPASINTPLFDKAETKLGVKPIGIPPLYAPEAVTQAILHAAENPTCDIFVGGAGYALDRGQRLSPKVMDEILLRTAFRGQKTKEPRSAQAPNNLFGPAGRYNRVQGDFGALTFKRSLATWLQLHPAAKGAAMLGAATAASWLLRHRDAERSRVGDLGKQRPRGAVGAR